MPQDKRPLGLRKPKAAADKTRVSKIVKDPTAGPNYSEFNTFKDNLFNRISKNPNAWDTSEYRKGYLDGVSNAKRGKLASPDKEGKPKLVQFPFRGETGKYAEGRLEGEKRYYKKK